MPLQRLAANPLLTPGDLASTRDDLAVLCTLNPAAVRYGDETVLLVRVGEKAVEQDGYVSAAVFDADAGEVKILRIPRDDKDLQVTDGRACLYRGRMLLSSLSHLRVARSRDGLHFTFAPHPAIFPATPYEAYGCEDPRITYIEGRYCITYTAVSDRGVTVAMASTEDFVHFERHGVIFPPFQKDVCVFPRTVGGLFVCRHRPFRSEFNAASIWTAYSPDLISWGRHEMTLAPRVDDWTADRVGCGAPPVATSEGWLEIFHGCDARGRYCLGAMLSDLEAPHRVLHRSSRPVLEPQASYELAGVYGQCVFSNGMIADEDGRLMVYYGAADRICAAAVTTVDEMVAAAKQ